SRYLLEGRSSQFRRYDIGRKIGRRRPEHAPADVGRKAAAGSAQVEWKHFGQVFPEIAELRHGDKAARGHSDLKESRFMAEQVEIGERNYQQARYLEHSKQSSA